MKHVYGGTRRSLSRHLVRGALAGAVGGLIVGALAAPSARADVPGDPLPNCETMTVFVTTVYCDGPVRPDGSWKRCWSWPGSMAGNYYSAGGTSCAINTPGNIQPLIGPKYHIGGGA